MLFDINLNSLQASIVPDGLRSRVTGAYSTVNYGDPSPGRPGRPARAQGDTDRRRGGWGVVGAVAAAFADTGGAGVGAGFRAVERGAGQAFGLIPFDSPVYAGFAAYFSSNGSAAP